MPSVRTTVDVLLAAAPPGTLRHEVLECVRRFKSSWADLGALLVRVQDERRFQEWGFPSFEAYCTRELHLRRATAEKLVLSYRFLSRNERGLASDAAERARAPAFEVVSVLADAERRGQLGPDDYRRLREEIWAPKAPPQVVARELRERFPPPAPPPPPAELQVRRLAQAARRLADELRRCRQVPKAIAERAAALADDVAELAAEL